MSIVSMEQKMCPVTGEIWDTGSLLFEKKFTKKGLKDKTVTGYAFSPEVQKIIDTGKIALVVVDKSKSVPRGDTLKQEDAHRTGQVAYLDGEVAKNLFGDVIDERAFAFIEEDVYDMLEKQASKQDEDELKLD